LTAWAVFTARIAAGASGEWFVQRAVLKTLHNARKTYLKIDSRLFQVF